MDIVQARTMGLPERSDFCFQVDQLDAMRKSMMQMLDMFMMNAVAPNEAGLYAMQQRLLDSGELGVPEKMMSHAWP
jgi:hypothetical protein